MAKYTPGNEPDNIKKRLKTLFDKLNTWYPDKVVIGLNSDHKKAGETVTELYRLLEYPDGSSFLKAYGYGYAQKPITGRPKGMTPQEAIEILKKRYPDGSDFTSPADLFEANPDLPFKTIANHAQDAFGMPFKKYLLSIGLIKNSTSQNMEALDQLKNRYPEGSPYTTVESLLSANKDLANSLKALESQSNEVFGMTFKQYLLSVGILSKKKKEIVCCLVQCLGTKETFCCGLGKKRPGVGGFVELALSDGAKTYGQVQDIISIEEGEKEDATILRTIDRNEIKEGLWVKLISKTITREEYDRMIEEIDPLMGSDSYMGRLNRLRSHFGYLPSIPDIAFYIEFEDEKAAQDAERIIKRFTEKKKIEWYFFETDSKRIDISFADTTKHRVDGFVSMCRQICEHLAEEMPHCSFAAIKYGGMDGGYKDCSIDADYVAGIYHYKSIIYDSLSDREIKSEFSGSLVEDKLVLEKGLAGFPFKVTAAGVSSSEIPDHIDFKGVRFTLQDSGDSSRYFLEKIPRIIEENGGSWKRYLTNSTKYVIVPQDKKHIGSPTEKAFERIRQGDDIIVLTEEDFRSIVEKTHAAKSSGEQKKPKVEYKYCISIECEDDYGFTSVLLEHMADLETAGYEVTGYEMKWAIDLETGADVSENSPVPNSLPEAYDVILLKAGIENDKKKKDVLLRTICSFRWSLEAIEEGNNLVQPLDKNRRLVRCFEFNSDDNGD